MIDELLTHETGLPLEEHYTNTAEYMDQVFGLTHVVIEWRCPDYGALENRQGYPGHLVFYPIQRMALREDIHDQYQEHHVRCDLGSLVIPRQQAVHDCQLIDVVGQIPNSQTQTSCVSATSPEVRVVIP